MASLIILAMFWSLPQPKTSQATLGWRISWDSSNCIFSLNFHSFIINMFLLQSCLIFCSAFTRLFNSKYLINIKHKWRILAMLFLSTSAYVILGICNMTQEKWGFFLSLVGSLMIGICSSLGESVVLGI